jgi:chromosome segregation ATPase
MNIKTLIALALGCAMFAVPARSAPQNSDQGSVADAARKAQAEKKTAPKAKMVIDNDNLGTLTGTVNVVGPQPAAAPSDDQARNGPNDKSAAPVKGEAYWRSKFASANKKLADDSRELDILQREFNLKQEQFYTDPMASLKQEYSRSDLNDSKAKIDEKSALVDQDKTEIANLEDQLRQAGGDPGWEAPPAQPASGAESTPAAAPQQMQPGQPASQQ